MKKNIIAMIACLVAIANVCGCSNDKIIDENIEIQEEYEASKTEIVVTIPTPSVSDSTEEPTLEYIEPVIIPDSIFEDEKEEMQDEIFVEVIPSVPDIVVTPNTDKTTEGVQEELDIEDAEQIEYKYIGLTFDDGPSKYTSELLDILNEYDASATFFVVGNRLNSYKDELRDIVESGCEIGVHTYSHTSFTSLGVEGMLDEINKTRGILDEYEVPYSNLVRPPYGSLNTEIKEGAEFPLILWNVDTRDWESRNAESVCEEIIKGVTEGNIILLHDIHPTTIEGVRLALSKLSEEYKFVGITELSRISNISLENGKTYYSLKLK